MYFSHTTNELLEFPRAVLAQAPEPHVGCTRSTKRGGRCHISYFDADLGQHGLHGAWNNEWGRWEVEKFPASRLKPSNLLSWTEARPSCRRSAAEERRQSGNKCVDSARRKPAASGCVERSDRINKIWPPGKHHGGGWRPPWFRRRNFNNKPRRVFPFLFDFPFLSALEAELLLRLQELGRGRAAAAATAVLRCSRSGWKPIKRRRAVGAQSSMISAACTGILTHTVRKRRLIEVNWGK